MSCVICAFSFGIDHYTYYSYYSSHSSTSLNALFWIFLIVGPLVAYISSMFIYAFGELVENTSDINKQIKKSPLTESTPEKQEEAKIEEALKF